MLRRHKSQRRKRHENDDLPTELISRDSSKDFIEVQRVCNAKLEKEIAQRKEMEIKFDKLRSTIEDSEGVICMDKKKCFAY